MLISSNQMALNTLSGALVRGVDEVAVVVIASFGVFAKHEFLDVVGGLEHPTLAPIPILGRVLEEPAEWGTFAVSIVQELVFPLPQEYAFLKNLLETHVFFVF